LLSRRCSKRGLEPAARTFHLAQDCVFFLLVDVCKLVAGDPGNVMFGGIRADFNGPVFAAGVAGKILLKSATPGPDLHRQLQRLLQASMSEELPAHV